MFFVKKIIIVAIIKNNIVVLLKLDCIEFKLFVLVISKILERPIIIFEAIFKFGDLKKINAKFTIVKVKNHEKYLKMSHNHLCN